MPEPFYLIDRFDRVLHKNHWQRRHVIDACQLLGLDRSCKYLQGSMDNLAAQAKACRSPAVARTRLFSWLVFNVLTGNGDAHLKSYLTNHALTAPITHGKLDFGTWQQIFYAEFDGKRSKRVLVKVTGLK